MGDSGEERERVGDSGDRYINGSELTNAVSVSEVTLVILNTGNSVLGSNSTTLR